MCGTLVLSNEEMSHAFGVDGQTGRIKFSTQVGVEPEGIAVSPDGSKVYVTAETSNTVSVLDAATGRLRKTIPVGENPRTVAVTPDARRAYEIGRASCRERV